MGAFNFFMKEIAIDLGTANTIIIYNDKVVVDEPSIVAIEEPTGKVLAVGKKAMMMQGRTHSSIRTAAPVSALCSPHPAKPIVSRKSASRSAGRRRVLLFLIFVPPIIEI